MRVFVTTTGTSGDLHPFIAVARQLRERGSRLTFFGNAYDRCKIEQAGFEFVDAAVAWDVNDIPNHPEYAGPLGPLQIWRQVYLATIPIMYRAIAAAAAVDRPDLLLGHTLCHGGLWAADSLGIKKVVLTLQPAMWPSRDKPAVMSDWHPPLWLLRRVTGPAQALLNAVTDRLLNKKRRDLGLGRKKNMLYGAGQQADLVLGLWSPLFRGAAIDDPSGCSICGFPVPAEPQPLSADLMDFVQAGPPPIVVGLGTSAVHLAEGLFHNLIEACRDLGQRCVLVGWDKSQAPFLPEHAFTTAYAPFTSLFPLAKLVVHHCGIGTAAAALRSGVPHLLVPFGVDQFDNARRIQDLGMAVTLSGLATTLTGMRRSLKALLTEQRYAVAAKKVQQQMLSESDGIECATTYIRKLLPE